MKRILKLITVEDSLFLFLIFLPFLTFAQPTRWFHLTVLDGEEGAEVQVKLPLPLLKAGLSFVKTDDFQHGKVKIEMDREEIDFPRLFQEIKKAPEGEYITIQEKDEEVKIEKKHGYLNIMVKENQGKEKVKIHIPEKIMDAFIMDEEGYVDINALIDALAKIETKELIAIEDGASKVRMWIE